MVNIDIFILFLFNLEDSYFEILFESKNYNTEQIENSFKTKKEKLDSDKRLNFSDSKIKFENINIYEDIIDIYLLYNGEIVKSTKTESKNYHRIMPYEIGISNEFQQVIFEIVNKIELTIKIKFSNKSSNKEMSFKSRIKYYNKKAKKSNIPIDEKKNKEIAKNKTDKIHKEDNEKNFVVHTLNEEKEEHNNKKLEKENDIKGQIIKIWNQENSHNIGERLSLISENENKNKKIIDEYDLKIKELQSLLKKKEDEILELSSKLENLEILQKQGWNEIVTSQKGNNILITSVKNNNKEININRIKHELILQNTNKIELYGNKKEENINNQKPLEIFQLLNIEKFFIEGKKKIENIKEKKDEIKIMPIKKEPLQINSFDKFTIKKKKKLNYLLEKKDCIQLLSKEKEILIFQNSDKFTIKKPIKPLNKIQKKESLNLISFGKEKKEKSNKWITEISEINKLTIERKEKFLNKICANEKIELIGIKKEKNDGDKINRNEEKNE